jgi:hypothetical protein
MTLPSPPKPLRLPIVAIGCAVLFALAVFWVGAQETVACQGLTNQVQCQVQQALWGQRLPLFTTDFEPVDVEVHSTLCDNTPPGGVRFCHRVLLLTQDNQAYPLPEFYSPLSPMVIKEYWQEFIQGNGKPPLPLNTAEAPNDYLTIAGLGVLLMVVAWGFWDIQWPLPPVSPMARDEWEPTDPPSHPNEGSDSIR